MSKFTVVARTKLFPNLDGDFHTYCFEKDCNWEYKGTSTRDATIKLYCRLHSEATGHETMYTRNMVSDTSFAVKS